MAAGYISALFRKSASLPAFVALSALAGFSVSNGLLLDTYGHSCVLRGINHLHPRYATLTTQALNDIASTGSNTVHIVLSNGRQSVVQRQSCCGRQHQFRISGYA